MMLDTVVCAKRTRNFYERRCFVDYKLEPHQHATLSQAWQAYVAGRRDYLPLFDDPGVGKTPVYVNLASRIAQHRKQSGHQSPVAWLVTENTARTSQRDKVFQFDPRFDGNHDPLGVIILEGSQDDRQTQIQMAAALRVPWVIMNYSQLVIHAEDLLQWFSPDDILVADEADLASPSGNNVSQRFNVVKALACVAHYRIAATGSPIRNRVDTLYNLFLMLDPTRIVQEQVELGTRVVTMPQPYESRFWGKRYADFLYRYGVFDGDRLIDIQRKQELHDRLLDYGASLTTKDVLGIEREKPEVITHPLSDGQRRTYEMVKLGYLEMAEEIEQAYRYRYGERDSVLQSFLAQISYARFVPGLSPTNFKRVVALNRAKRLGKDTLLSLVEYLHLDQMVEDGGNSRVDEALRLVATFDWERDGGIIFYSPFKEVVKELGAAAERCGYAAKYGFGLITGDVSAKERDAVRQRVANGTCRIVAISNAGGRSIDLTNLNVAVSLITPWTHTEEEQAMGRIERWGQARPVKTIYLAAENTIETKHMLGLLGGKGRASDDVKSGRRGRRMHFEEIASVYDVVGWL
jgi:hypothetical protein